MTFSDALPVQFWLSECDTFNQHEAGGVHHVCWCQPWNCDDQILIQFIYTAAQSISLIANNPSGLIIAQDDFSEVQSGVYQALFTPEDYDICDEFINFQIVDSSVVKIAAPSTWTDGSLPTQPFDTKGATSFTESLSTVGQFTARAFQNATIPSGERVKMTVHITVTGTWTGSIAVFIYSADGSGGDVSTGTKQFSITANTNADYEFDYTLTGNAQRLYVDVLNGLSTGSATIVITLPVEQIIYVPDSAVLAKSDCLEIAESHDETIFIEYSNQRNFAGLIYENDSPDTTFGIRVPCRFFHEVEPEEDEAMELTSSVITTSSQVKTQRLLEVKHAPYYFHKKLRRILKHQTLTIFDKQWKKEEKYEVVEGKKTWPLKAATCLLTEKNSIIRNVL